MQKIHLKPEVLEALQFLLKAAESYFGAINGAKTYQPHIDTLNKNIVDEPDEKKEDEPK